MTKVRRASTKSPARLKRKDHLRLWRMVEGAVVDAFTSHPDYLTDKGRHAAAESVTKRVVGSLVGSLNNVPRHGP